MKKILITGGSGLIGSSICQELGKSRHWDIYAPSSKELDMESTKCVEDIFFTFRPDVVFNLAARVGGIKANLANPVSFFNSNIEIALNTYKFSAKFGVKKIVNAGAGCGYPLNAEEPLKEDDLWNGLPQRESLPYSTAKKLLTILGEIYEKEHGIVSTTFIPSNVYGPRDNFNIEQGHVIPALIHKFFLAKRFGHSKLEVLGDGSAMRDFIYVEDAARAMVSGIHATKSDVVNVATGKQISIRDLVNYLISIFDYSGTIRWDVQGPSGSSSRLMDIGKISRIMGIWSPIDLMEGLNKTVAWFSSSFGLSGTRI